MSMPHAASSSMRILTVRAAAAFMFGIAFFCSPPFRLTMSKRVAAPAKPSNISSPLFGPARA
jgi:hypothetical protein